MPISELMSMMKRGTVQGSKSTAMTPFIYTIGVILSAILLASKASVASGLCG